MSKVQKTLLCIAICLMAGVFFVIVFGDTGLLELNVLKSEQNRLIRRNEEINRENQTLARQIDRLKNDPAYVESIARQELGLVGRGEVVIELDGKKGE